MQEGLGGKESTDTRSAMVLTLPLGGWLGALAASIS
jgi:hypothetical protein